ncbi:MAG: cytochrome P450 [Vicinamibacteria bacterium]
MAWPDDPIAAVTHPDPYPYYASLAAEPMRRHPALSLLVAARADDVAAVLSSPLVRVRPPAERVPRAIAGGAAGALFGRLVRMTDGAEQEHAKRAVRTALASVDAAEARAAARSHAALRAEALDLQDRTERAMDVAWHAPVRTIAELIGLHPADEAPRWTRALAGGFAAGAGPEEGARSSEAAARLHGGLTGTSLHGALGAAADGLDADWVAANALGFLSQTLEATAGLVGNALVAAGRSPDRWRAPVDALVGHVLRHDPPVHNTRRFVAEPGTVAGVPVASGDAILVVLAAAALPFGAGGHACPGDALASALAAGTLDALLASGLDPAELAHPLRYRPSPNVRVPVFAEGGLA